MASSERRGYSLGGAHVDPASGEIRDRRGTDRLEPRLVAVLDHLVRHRGQVVSREEMLAEIWSADETYDESLTQAISKLRMVLGDSARSPRLIETLPKRGYRLIGEITWDSESTGPIAHADHAVVERGMRRPAGWWLGGGIALLLTAAIVVAWYVSETDPDLDPDIRIEDMELDDQDP